MCVVNTILLLLCCRENWKTVEPLTYTMVFVMESLLVFRLVRACMPPPPPDRLPRRWGGSPRRRPLARGKGPPTRRRPVPIARVCAACERAPRVCTRSRVYAAVIDVLRDALANRWLQYHSAATIIILYTCAPRLTSVRLT